MRHWLRRDGGTWLIMYWDQWLSILWYRSHKGFFQPEYQCLIKFTLMLHASAFESPVAIKMKLFINTAAPGRTCKHGLINSWLTSDRRKRAYVCHTQNRILVYEHGTWEALISLWMIPVALSILNDPTNSSPVIMLHQTTWGGAFPWSGCKHYPSCWTGMQL